MKKISLITALILLIVLTSCTQDKQYGKTEWENALFVEDTVLGEGEKTIDVEVKAGEKSIVFTINTNAENLADALLEHNLIEGENSIYGIYIKKVNGILADFDVDKYYWSLTKNGEYVMTGAESTVIADGEHYELVRTK